MSCDSTRCADEAERVEIVERNYAAMAKMLERLQWCAEEIGGNECCPICGHGPFKRPDPRKPKEPDGHAPDCELVAVLRAAGVIE